MSNKSQMRGISKPKHYSDIANENLQMIIEKDLGVGARLISWESSYFTKVGDHFLGKVKSIHCQVSVDRRCQDVRYVVKLNPRRPLEVFRIMTHSFFVKEGKYLFEVVPVLNSILRTANLLPLNVPQCLYVSYTPEEEVIMLKDLREQNYKMYDKMSAMDINHLLLVVQELAKQHSSSYVHYLMIGKRKLNEMYPYMKDLWLDEKNPGSFQYINYCKMRISSTIKALEELKSYPEALSWLKENESILFDFFVNQWQNVDPKFKVICHGDCWTNNMLFQYDEKDTDKPSKVILLDFQQCRISSLATDLHILLTTTTNGDTRMSCRDRLLCSYYKTFNRVCIGAGRHTPFSYPQLLTEFRDKATFGFLLGILRLPLLLNDDPESLDFDNMDAETYIKFIEDEYNKLPSMLSTNQKFKERYFSVLETASKDGVFNGVMNNI